MNFKILALVLVAFFLLFAGCAKKGETTEVGATAGAASANGTTNVGNLFKIDTDKPEEGSGYNVPAPSGN
jgi:uncharacterized lipoprotein YajG